MESLPLPLEWLCDPANWGFVRENLEPMPFPVPPDDSRAWMTGLGIAASQYRYKYRLSLITPLTALASPSVRESMEPYLASLARFDLDMHSFGAERAQIALIEPSRFRYFEKDDGWTATFTLPAPGLLVTLDDVSETAGVGGGI